jgi:hypothetical protein
MAWDVDDIISIELRQDYLEQGLVNILFYKIIDIVGTAITNALLDLLVEAITDFITPSQNADLEHIEQIVNNLSDGVSQYLATYNVPGELPANDVVASFFAAGLKKSVSTRITRPGSIRIAGLREAGIEANSLAAAYLAIVDLTAVDLGSTVIINDQAGTVATFNPVVVGRNPDGSFDVARINDITSFGLARLTTQNSRKPER